MLTRASNQLALNLQGTVVSGRFERGRERGRRGNNIPAVRRRRGVVLVASNILGSPKSRR